MNRKGALYLIPSTLGAGAIARVIPAGIRDVVNAIDNYVVEDIRTARRYLSKLGINKPIQSLEFAELNKRTTAESIPELLQPALKGMNMGLLSEAGCPGVADPGAELVSEAHRLGIKVIPLAGPSSLLLALMASGMNGQHFTFHGYLPRDSRLRCEAILRLEKLSRSGGTQIFIETPYRNQHMFDDIIKVCGNTTRLCLATDLTLESESVVTRNVADWKSAQPALNKRPTVFLLGS